MNVEQYSSIPGADELQARRASRTAELSQIFVLLPVVGPCRGSGSTVGSARMRGDRRVCSSSADTVR